MCITDEFTSAGVSKKGQHFAEFAGSSFALLARAAWLSTFALMMVYSA
jgi:hypothetical protein